MKNDNAILRQAVLLALSLPACVAWAQEDAAQPEAQQAGANQTVEEKSRRIPSPVPLWEEQSGANQPIEEVVVVGRFLSAAESLVTERLTVPFSAEFLGADVIARAGDPDIASALRRVPGLTVVDGKFVYVRGLGERYSSVTVNSAAVPSPELTRSVIPLDLFPTSIVDSIKIQKSPSPDQPAGFGGGAIDIRTSSLPIDVVADVSIGLGFNDISDSNGLVFPGQATPVPAAIMSAIDTYTGDISVSRIFSQLRQSNALVPISEAQTIHPGLIDSLNTNVAPRIDTLDNDSSLKLALGNSWDLNENWRFGALLNATYSDQYRNENQYRESVGNPVINFFNVDRTVQDERTVGALNFGVEYLGDHLVELATYKIQNDEFQASIARGFDSNNEKADNDQAISYQTRIEQRELQLTQVSGRHAFMETPWIGDKLRKLSLGDLEFDWFYSDAQATTAIPNQATFQAGAVLDPVTGQQLSTSLFASTSMGQFSFLDLNDDQTSWGGNLILPLDLDRAYLTLSSGWWGFKKARDYVGYNINLNAVGVPEAFRAGGPADVLALSNLQVSNGFDLSLGSQFGTESYVAAQTIDAGYGMLDVDFNNNWRFTVGARYENYRQAVLPLDLLDYTGQSTINLQNQISEPDQTLAVKQDDVFSSAALTYNSAGLLGSDDYQIRVSYGETIVRPDLREVADVTYIDPEFGIRVGGNPNLKSSPIDNFELRGEFYYGDGDNFTVSFFWKDISAPIEQVRQPGSDDDFKLTFENALAGDVSGVEFEGLKRLPRGFFVSGNLTLSDSEVRLDPASPNNLTNYTRRMTGHSEWVVNTTLGFDSDNGQHSAYLNINAFGERIYSAGTDNHDDVYEEPFDSLGFVYKYFPTDRIELQLKVDNLLDETRRFTQVSSSGATAHILTQSVGSSLSLSGRWSF
jgi:outer membrane receptor protein involved in Fe transport